MQLVAGLHLPVAMVVFDHPLGSPNIRIGDGIAHLIERDAVLLKLLRLQLDPHRRQRTPAHLHLAHPWNLRQLLRQDCRADVVELPLAEHVGG